MEYTSGVYIMYSFLLENVCFSIVKRVSKKTKASLVSLLPFLFEFSIIFFRENLTQKMGFFSPGSINLSPATWYSLVIVTIWKLVSNLMSLSFDLYDYA